MPTTPKNSTRKGRNGNAGPKTGEPGGEIWILRLYVAGQTPNSLTAFENLTKICEEHAGGKYRITVIDLLRNPEIARKEDITAIPTLVRVPRSPGRRKIIGVLTNTEKVLEELDLPKRASYDNHESGRLVTRTAHSLR